MKRVIAAFAAILAAVTTLAQNSIKVEVHNIVGLDERFNVMFIIEGEDKLIAAIGVHDLVIVDTEDATLICAKDSTADIKKIVENLRICMEIG